MISLDSKANKITNYFQLPRVSGGEPRGKVRRVIPSEVIHRCEISESCVSVLKQSKQQALRKEYQPVIVHEARNSGVSKGFLSEVDS